MGDATNGVLILAGEMLKKAEHLLIMGLHPSEIIKGYELASVKALSELECMLSPCHIKHRCLIALPDIRYSPLDIFAALTTHQSLACHRAEAGNRLETVWLRRPARGPRRGSLISRHATKSQKLQRRQRPRRQDHGRKPQR